MNKRLIVFGSVLFLIGLIIFSFRYRSTVKVISLHPSVLPRPPFSFAKVVHVIDGDTVVIDTGQHIRYIGMNTPEIETSECFATEAGEINKNLVLGKIVKLVKDVSETDKYGRLLRYVYVGDTFVDDELVKEGAAKIMTIPPDVKYKNQFDQSEKYAKENNLGLWSKCF